MAAGELLACSKFYVSFDGLDDLIVSKVSGVSIEFYCNNLKGMGTEI
ncbi:hypothetical protein [Calothrix sp. CCY 0018]